MNSKSQTDKNSITEKQDNNNQSLNPRDRKIVNEEAQNVTVNKQDQERLNNNKEKGFKGGLKDGSISNKKEELPGEHDDSKKTIRETPKMK